MRKVIKSVSVMLTIVYLLMIPLNASAAIGNISAVTSADTALLNKWKGMGLLDSSVSTSDLDKPIQKIDFITFINQILNSSRQANIDFSDVPKDSWYGKEIAKAVASGFVTNEGNIKFEPFVNITRYGAAEMVAHVFGLELKDKKILDKITDAQKLDNNQLDIFGAVVEKGYISEVSNGKYAPMGVIKLIDAIKLLDKCIGQVIAKEGTTTTNAAGNVLVNKSLVTLKNMEIAGDLIIGEGVSDGTVNLDNVSVKGKMIIRGGGPNGIHIKSSKITSGLIVEKYAGNVNVVAEGTTTIEKTVIKSGGKLSESGLTSSGKGFINVICSNAVEANQTANLAGDFSNIELNNCNLNVILNGNADNINISKDSTASFVLTAGDVKDITILASRNTIELNGGTIGKVSVKEDAKGNKIDINDVSKISEMSIGDNSTINFIKGTIEDLTFEVPSGGSYLSMKSGSYLMNIVAHAAITVTGAGVIKDAYVYANNVSIDIKPNGVYVADNIIAYINGTSIDPTKPTVSFNVPSSISLQQGEEITVDVINLNPEKSILAYISSDNSIATVDKTGVITGVSVGNTKIHVTGQYTNYNSKVADINVTVISGNVTVPGTLEIDPESGEASTIAEKIVLTYTAGDNLSNGTLIIRLPAGFQANTSDTVQIGSDAAKALVATQLPNSQTISLTNVDLPQGQTIVITLNNKVIPAGEEGYTFSAVADADGYGPKLPTTGTSEKAVFTVDRLRELMEKYNYVIPDVPYGTVGGSMKLTNLSLLGITDGDGLKWMIKVQDADFEAPKYDDDLTNAGYLPYTAGQDIMVAEGQKIRLVVVDKDNKLKAYKDLTVKPEWIRPNDAAVLESGVNYIPAPGIKAGAVRINALSYTGVDHWMIKIQDTAPNTVFDGSVLTGAGVQNYTEGDDISMLAGQHVVLAAVDAQNKIMAYADIAAGSLLSVEANKLQAGNSYSVPAAGPEIGTTKIQYLNKGNMAIDKWMYVLLSKDSVQPGLNAATEDFEKYYTEGKLFTEYEQNNKIPVTAEQHLMLVGVKTDGTKYLIQAYANMTIKSNQILGASAPEIPGENIGALEMGSTKFTTRISSLSLTGSAILVDAEKFMIKVQNTGLTEAPQLDSTLNGFSDYIANSDIMPGSYTVIVLLATDKNGKIKAYKNIAVDPLKIRPGDAPTFSTYRFVPGTDVNSTRIMNLPAGGPTGITGTFARWEYKISNMPFEKPYLGSILGGTVCNNGDQISGVHVSQHILLVAVDAAGQTLAYADETLNTSEIKQPTAEILQSNLDTPIGFNYTMPEPGSDGGTTMIGTMDNWNITGAQRWYYKISSTQLEPDYDSSVVTGANEFNTYAARQSVSAAAGKYFILLATDNSGHIKAYANIALTEANISLQMLKTPLNYLHSIGSTAGTTKLTNLAFTGITGSDSSWKWMYAVGDAAFPVPGQNTPVSSLSYSFTTVTSGETTATIAITPNKYILLLAVDGSGIIKAYANILVDSSKVKPSDAQVITNYTLEKGYAEGTTRFSALDLSLVSGATQWMIYVQPTGLTENIGIDTSAPANAIRYNYSQTTKPDITVNVNDHIILLATDSSSAHKIKAYADITVISDWIQTPFAYALKKTTDYTGPRAGTDDGTTTFTLIETNVPDKESGTVVWKYKTGAQQFALPHLDDDAADYTELDASGNFPVQSNDWLLVVATVDGKVKAYFQEKISSGSIKPKEAPPLVEGKNYSAPVAGSEPGTTKFGLLDPISLPNTFAGWAVKVYSTSQTVMQDTYFGSPLSSIGNIQVQKNQFVVLAAVNSAGNVIAYKCIQITDDTQISPTAFDNNYSGPQMGTDKGTVSFIVSLNGLSGAVGFAAKVSDTQVSLGKGDAITYSTDPGPDFTNYKVLTSYENINVKANQYVVLVAVDSSSKVVAYANILVLEDRINPGDAVLLEETKNYRLETGSGSGTVRFTYLNKVGVPGVTTEKWVVQIANNPITTPPTLNTKVSDTTGGYVLGSNINVTVGTYVILYSVEASTNGIKGYVCIQVKPAELVVNSAPVPGSDYFTTKLDTAQVTVPAGTTLKYVVQNNSAGVILTNDNIPGLQAFTFGDNIPAAENQYLILAAVESDGKINAYKEIKVTAAMLKIPNTSASLSGTLISAPVSEANIAAGGKTLVITLNDGKWVSDIAANATVRNSLYDNLKLNGTTDSTMWANVIAALKGAGQASAPGQPGITRTDDTTVTIVFPQVPSYEISKSQTITLTIPAKCNVSNKDIPSDKTITIENLATATVTSASYKETDINAGNKTIVITLDGATWVSDVGSNAAIKEALVRGLTADSDPGNQWASVVQKLVDGGGSVTRGTGTKTNVVTIKLPAVETYDIAANQTISVTVPTSAAIGTSFGIQSTGTVTITPVTTIVPAAIVSVTATESNKSYKLGDTVSINVKFDKNVSVSSTPTLALQTVSGSTSTKNASYASGTGTDTLVFTYKVATGDRNPLLEYKSGGSISGTVVNSGTSTAVNKALPPIGGGYSLGTSNIAIDGVVPQFSSGYPKAGSWTAADDVSIPVKLNDSADIYYVAVLYNPANIAPTTDQINAGTANTTVVTSGTLNVTDANTEYPLNLTGLTDNTGYTVYMYAEDACGNKSAVASVTVDNKPPKINDMQAIPADYSISLTVNINEPGNIYAVALANGSPAPTSQQVKAYSAKVTQAVTADTVNTDVTLKITKSATSTTASVPLNTSTDYDIYIVCEDVSTAKNLSGPVIIEAKTTPMDLTKVDVDLANNTILNTNASMQYSLDGYSWTTCNSPATANVNFVYNETDLQIKVYIREVSDTSHVEVITLGKGSTAGIDSSLIDYDILAGKVYNNSDINLEFRINGGAWKSLGANKTVSGVVFVPGDLELRTAATSPTAAGRDAKIPSDAVIVDGIPSKGEAPELTYDDAANKINGLSDDYEYSVNGGNWVSGELAAGRPNEFAGTKKVLVRHKATAVRIASMEQEIQFTANVIKVTAAPAEGTTKATVKIEFEENTNKPNQALTAQQIKDWFDIGTTAGVPHEWGTEISGKFNSTGKVLTITFNSMAGSTFVIGDMVEVTTGAAIQNSTNTSGAYTSTGKLGGSFHTVPAITSIKAVNTSGEKLIITFDQATNQKNITPANLANYLIVTNSTGKTARNWSKANNANPNVTLTWTSDKVLTISFNNFSDTDIIVNDKIRVNAAWGLKDADNTTEACNSAQFITGSFTP